MWTNKSTVECWTRPVIEMHQPRIDTWSVSWLALDQHLVNSQPSVNHVTYIDGKLVDSQLSVNWDVER